MHGMPNRFRPLSVAAFLCVLSVLQACSVNAPALMHESARVGDSQPGALTGSSSGLLLQPVPLYGLPELSVGAGTGEDSGEVSLLLCDEQKRRTEQGKPLVVYLDGEHELLRWRKAEVYADCTCHYFEASRDILLRIANAERALLRVYFSSGTVEQRISGTLSDYLSRPKALGPQQGLRRFVNALSSDTVSGSVVSGQF